MENDFIDSLVSAFVAWCCCAVVERISTRAISDSTHVELSLERERAAEKKENNCRRCRVVSFESTSLLQPSLLYALSLVKEKCLASKRDKQ